MNDWAHELRRQAEDALPKVEGEIRVRGLREPVEVIRDRWGVPHIFARNQDDLYLAQGFVAASERLWQIDFTFRLASGRLSTMFGDLTLPMDRFARTVGWNRAGRRIARKWDELSRDIAASWIRGLHAAIETLPAQPVEYGVLGVAPDIPRGEDALAGLASCAVFISWTLSGNWETELLRAEIEEGLGPEAARLLCPGPAGARGSNAWAVAGSRTASGRPLLANDPHLPVSTPSTWFECRLTAPGIDVAGVCLPYAPGIPIGRTPRTAWGVTNVGGDVQDLYRERLNDDGAAALYDDEWEPLTVHRERIEVRGRTNPEVLEARETRHGPLLGSYMLGVGTPVVVEGGIRETLALRWTGLEEATPPSTLHRMALARNFGEFHEAARTWVCPGSNLVYADVDGNIGYQCTGTYPVRRNGDGGAPVPGWTSEFEWAGSVPYEELPWALNPPEGYIVSANQRPPGNADPIGRDFTPSFRAERITELLETVEQHTPDTFARIQTDTISGPAREMLPLLHVVEPHTPRQREALALLSGWDGDLAADSDAAALYQVWSARIAERVLRPRLGEALFDHYHWRSQQGNIFQFEVLPQLLRVGSDWLDGEVLLAALDDALDELTQLLGEDVSVWRWGALHRVRFAHHLASVPGLEELFTAAVVETGGDEHTVGATAFCPGEGYEATVVPSWRQVIDLSDIDASAGIHTTGQSGNPASHHWNDMAQDWSTGRYHPLLFTREAVERHADARLLLSAG